MADPKGERRPRYDVHALHFPAPERKVQGFDQGVGTSGYERGTGTEVPKKPVLRRPGEKEPAADPFSSH